MELSKLIKNKSFNDVQNMLSQAPYHISVKVSDYLPNSYMLVYQNEISDFSIPAVRECRGIILEKETNKILCYTFEKKNRYFLEF